jgi:hypothetical protein
MIRQVTISVTVFIRHLAYVVLTSSLTMDNGGNIFKKLFQLLKTAKRVPPQSGDGLYNSEDDLSKSAPLKAGIIKDLKKRKIPIPKDVDELLEVVKVANSGGLNVSLPEVLLYFTYPSC